MHERLPIEQIFTAHHSRLVRLASMMLNDDKEAEDMVADVFVRWAEQGAIPNPAILTTAVRNRCIDRLRQMKMAERIQRRLPLDYTDPPPLEEEEYEQRIGAVNKAIDSELTTQMRRALLLRYQDEKSYQEIAQIMDISETAVYKHLRNALERLRKHLNDKNA